MAENYIARLQRERDEAIQQIREIRAALTEMEIYLTSPKFSGPDSDFVYVRTDILPKIASARFLAITE